MMLQRNRFSAPAVFNAKKRMRIVVAIMLIAPLLITGRLCYLQLFRHEEYSSKAERAIYNYLAEDRLRGGIYDINGNSLAESVRTHSCGIVKRYVKDKEATVLFLAETLGMSPKEINKKWEKAKNFFFVAKKIKPDVYMQLAAVHRKPLGQGLELTPEYERIHPFGKSALDILGEANSKNVGLSGIEQMYNEELTQDISKKRARRSARGDIIYDRHLKEKINTGNIYLTIDETAQFYAERALQKAVEKNNPEHAIALVQDPNTGNILAAASYPLKDGQSLAFQFTYEPGSTFKSIAIATALDSGTLPPNASIYMEGRNWEVAKGFIVKDKQHNKDYLTLAEILQLSSNIGAGKVAVEIGPKTLFSYLKAFGFGSRTDINFNGESKGSVSAYNTWTKVDLATKGYGYGVAVTPIQLITAYSAIANGGYLMQPHLVDRIVYTGGKVDKKAKPIKIRRVISEETSKTMRALLQTVVEVGSGKRAQIKGYNVAGKTGTAEKLSKEGGYAKRSHVVSFCGMVPASKPQFTILVILDNPAVYAFGSTAAAPVFKEIAEPLLVMKGVPPDQLDFEE